MKRLLTCAVLVMFLVVPFSALGSTTFSTVVALGDSLTDNGSIVSGTNDDINDVHGFQYFTDGAVWVETLAGTMGSGLHDVAYGGATTGYDNPAAPEVFKKITGLQWQVEHALPAFDSDGTLFTVWAGANDFFQGRDFTDAAENIGTALYNLKAAGATSILVPNLPDLGLTPGFFGGPAQNAATGWTQAFNGQLNGVLQAFAGSHSSVDVYFLDVYTIFSDFILTENGEINPIFWDLLFYDAVHPTSFGHGIVAGEAYNVLQAGPMAVPVPAAVWLLGTGLIGLIGIRRNSCR